MFDKVARLGDRDFVVESVAEVQAILDPQRITQTMVALADNACRYTDSGGRIGLGSRVESGWLRFWITDSGPGVSDEDRLRIFQRFARGGAADRRSDGAGLGLAIVHAIAVAHGGDVLLDGAPGRGSTFSVGPASRPLLEGTMTHILIAEDEQRIASFIEKGLSANGFAVTTVTNG